MLGLILIYNVGKVFFDLADVHDKSKWGYAVWGVVSYYLGLLTGSILVGVFVAYNWPEKINDNSDYALGIAGIPFGILVCWGNYRFLKNRWENNDIVIAHDNLLDQDLY